MTNGLVPLRLSLLLAVAAGACVALASSAARAHEITPTPKEGIVVEVGKFAKLSAVDHSKCKAFLTATVGDPTRVAISANSNNPKTSHTWKIVGLQVGVTFVAIDVDGVGTNPQGVECDEVSTTAVPVVVIPNVSLLTKEFAGLAKLGLKGLSKQIKDKIKAFNLDMKDLLDDYDDGFLSDAQAFFAYWSLLSELQLDLAACTESTVNALGEGAQDVLVGGGAALPFFPRAFQSGSCDKWDKAVQDALKIYSKGSDAALKSAKKAALALLKTDDSLLLNVTPKQVLIEAKIVSNVTTEDLGIGKSLSVVGAASMASRPGQTNGSVSAWGFADPAVSNSVEVTVRGPGSTTITMTVQLALGGCTWSKSFEGLDPGLWVVEVKYPGKDVPKATAPVNVDQKD